MLPKYSGGLVVRATRVEEGDGDFDCSFLCKKRFGLHSKTPNWFDRKNGIGNWLICLIDFRLLDSSFRSFAVRQSAVRWFVVKRPSVVRGWASVASGKRSIRPLKGYLLNQSHAAPCFVHANMKIGAK